MADGGDDSSATSSKRIAKKKHYPFGTPSHLHTPFSEFAHLRDSTRDFAMNLAQATGIKAEVVEEQPKKRRQPSPTKSKLHEDEEDGEHHHHHHLHLEEEGSVDPADEIALAEGLQPCTKLPCQMVVRAIADIQYKNQIERMDIEDEYDRITDDLQAVEQESKEADVKLDRLNDIGNQLDIKLTQITTKVENLEKTKENLNNERAEINTKLMLLEVERQKANRLLEKAQKELTNARWRKKKAAQQANVEAGVTLPVSEISEAKIVQMKPTVVSSSESLHHTQYHQLAHGSVSDQSERPLTVKTVPQFVQDKLHNDPEKLDKYAQSHYRKLLDHSLERWEELDGTVLASTVGSPTTKFRPETNSKLLAMSLSQGSLSSSVPLLQGSRSMVMTVSTAASSRVGNTLLNRKEDEKSRSSKVLSSSAKKLRKHQDVYDNISSILNYSQELPRSASRGKSRSVFNTKLTPLTGSTSIVSALDQSHPLDAPASISSIDSADYTVFHHILAEDGIYLGDNKTTFHTTEESLEGTNQPSKKLDKTFVNDTARELWGRKAPLGKIRQVSNYVQETYEKKIKQKASTDSNTSKNAGKAPLVREASRKSFGLDIVDTRMLPMVKSRTLTVKHPGMHSFDDAITSIR